MTRILAVETSAEACSVALNHGGDVLERYEHAPLQHAERILPFVRAVLDEAGWTVGDLDVIAFGRGPGSFTSLRIGIGVVQGLAWGADVPVAPVSSLAAVAHSAFEAADGAIDPEAAVLVAMDARMGEVFHAAFARDARGFPAPLGAEAVAAPEAVEAPAGRPFVAAGNGFARYAPLHALAAGALSLQAALWPRAAAVLRLAQYWLEDHDPLPAERAQPVYVRNTVAQKPDSG